MICCLNDVRVIEVGQVLAGPFAGMILGDLGAEVLKVEPLAGDSARRTPPHFYKGESVYFMSLNRNKKSVAIDLAAPQGREVFLDLVRQSDVVLDNLRPGAAEKLGLHYEALSKVNPGVVACSINGYGGDTPDARKPAFDLMIQARAGGMSLTGTPGGPPTRMGVSITDHVSAIYAVAGVLAALHARQTTGKGRRVETPLFSTMLSLLSYEAALYLHSGEIPGPVGSAHRSLIPYNAVTTSDGHIVIDAHLPKFWTALCRVLNRPDLETDPRYATLDVRNQNRTDLLALLDREFSRHPGACWLERLEAAGVPCAPINDMAGAFADPLTKSLGMVPEIHHAGVDLKFRAPGNPIRMPDAETAPHQSPPLLGEHTEMVLKDLLGYDDERIRRLQEVKAVRS